MHHNIVNANDQYHEGIQRNGGKPPRTLYTLALEEVSTQFHAVSLHYSQPSYHSKVCSVRYSQCHLANHK
jgi:hypothetical protein